MICELMIWNLNSCFGISVMYRKVRFENNTTPLESVVVRHKQVGNEEPLHVKTYLLTCAPSQDSNQPAPPCSLIRVSVVRIKTFCILGYPQMRPVKILIRLRECEG